MGLRPEAAPAVVDAAERGPLLSLRRLVVGVFVLYVLVGVFLVMPRLTADGAGYYAQSRSLVLDGDGDLADEFRFDDALFAPNGDPGPREWVPTDYDGRARQYANVGIVVLFAPFILLGHVISIAIDALGARVSADGYDTPYVLAVSYGTNALIAAGLLLSGIVARRHARTWLVLLAIGAIWLGSTLTLFGVFRPFHAHGPAVFLEGLFAAVFLLRARDPYDRLAWLALGAITGLMIAVRPITAVYALAPLALLVWTAARALSTAWRGADQVSARVGAAARPLAALGIAGVLFLAGLTIGRIPQIVFAGDASLTGSSYYEESGYLTSGGENPLHGLAMLLLDGRQGAVLMAPVVVLALIGLAGWWRRDRLVLVSAVIWTAGVWAFVATLGYPKLFGGQVAASRHLIEASPAYVLGIIGLVLLAGDVAAWLRERSGASIERGRRIAVAATAGVVVAATGWGLLQHVSVQVISNPAATTPVARAIELLRHPALVRELWLDPTGGPSRGDVYLAGRLWLAVTERTWSREALLAVALMLAAGLAALALGAVIARIASGHSHPDRREAVLATVAWLPVAVIIGAVILPAYLPPMDQGASGQVVRHSWTASKKPAEAGTVGQVIVGESPFGNAVVMQPPPQAPVDGPDPGFASLAAGPLASGTTFALAVPDGWRSLASVVLDVRGLESGTELEVAAYRPGDLVPAIVSRMTADRLETGLLEVPLPMRLPDGTRRVVEISLVVPSGSASVALLDGGSVAVRARGTIAAPPASVTVRGSPIGSGPWLRDPLPPDTSLLVRADGTTQMRQGPWGVEAMLREAVSGQGWRIPGPTAPEGTWNDVAIEDPDSGTPLIFRVDAPQAIEVATATAIGRLRTSGARGTITIEASNDGVTWQVVEASDAGSALARPYRATFRPAPGATSVWFRVDVSSSRATAGLGGIWFDLDLTPTTMPAGVRSADVAVTPPSDPARPFRIDVQAPASGVEAILRDAAATVRDALTRPGPAVAWLLASGLLGVALMLAARGSITASGGVAVLVATFAVLGILGLPRVSLLGRTQSFEAGVAELATVRGEIVTAKAPGATYLSPTVELQPGSLVTSVDVGSTGSTPEVRVRTVASDGATGPWMAPSRPLDIGDAEGVQVELTFTAVGDRVNRLAVRSEPPIGRGPVPLIPSGYPRIGDPP